MGFYILLAIFHMHFGCDGRISLPSVFFPYILVTWFKAFLEANYNFHFKSFEPVICLVSAE